MNSVQEFAHFAGRNRIISEANKDPMQNKHPLWEQFAMDLHFISNANPPPHLTKYKIPPNSHPISNN